MSKYLLWMGLSITLVVCAIGLSQKGYTADYIGETEGYSTLNKGEFELEFKFGYGRNRDDNEHFYTGEFEMEYGVTEYFMVEGEAEFEHTSDEGTDFDEGSLALRYRFGEKGELPIDIAISGTLNTENDDGELEYALEPRLILAKDIGKFNVALNLPLDIPLEEGQAEFIPAMGLGYYATKNFRVGCEVKYNVESHEGSLILQIRYKLPLPPPEDVKIHLGFARGFDDNHEDAGIIGIEWEL